MHSPSLLQLLNDEQQEHHRELKNGSLTTRAFEKGDIVIIRRQVQSSVDKQVTAKGQFHAKPPYRVLKEATTVSWVQKIPFGPRDKQRMGNYEKREQCTWKTSHPPYVHISEQTD